MKKSVKVLIVVLVLIIIGLAGFIVWDKVINIKKDDEKTANSTQNNAVTNSNENVNSVNNTNATQKNDDETKIANEAIKKALKDKKWLEDNIYPGYYFEDNTAFKKLMEVYFTKIKSIDGKPAYLVDVTETGAASHYVYLITYKDGKVYTSKPVRGEYSIATADVNRNIVAIENDPTGITSVYNIENNEFVKFASADLNYNDDTLYYYVNNENVSYGRYKTYIENCVEMSTKLTDENIDKYVK